MGKIWTRISQFDYNYGWIRSLCSYLTVWLQLRLNPFPVLVLHSLTTTMAESVPCACTPQFDYNYDRIRSLCSYSKVWLQLRPNQFPERILHSLTRTMGKICSLCGCATVWLQLRPNQFPELILLSLTTTLGWRHSHLTASFPMQRWGITNMI